jgi:hypothetical protein
MLAMVATAPAPPPAPPFPPLGAVAPLGAADPDTHKILSVVVDGKTET